MALLTTLSGSYAKDKPIIERFVRMSTGATQRATGSPRRPDPPRALMAQSGSLLCRIIWQPPVDDAGIVGYRVWTPNETTPFQGSRDPTSLFAEITLPANTSVFVAVSSYNAQGVQSAKIPIIAKSNTDQLVVSGTGGGTGGTTPNPPPQWPYGNGGSGNGRRTF